MLDYKKIEISNTSSRRHSLAVGTGGFRFPFLANKREFWFENRIYLQLLAFAHLLPLYHPLSVNFLGPQVKRFLLRK